MPTLAGVKSLESKDLTSPAELKALKRVFLTLDTKKDEVIDWTEISDACVKLGHKANMKEIKLWVEEKFDEHKTIEIVVKLLNLDRNSCKFHFYSSTNIFVLGLGGK